MLSDRCRARRGWRGATTPPGICAAIRCCCKFRRPTNGAHVGDESVPVDVSATSLCASEGVVQANMPAVSTDKRKGRGPSVPSRKPHVLKAKTACGFGAVAPHWQTQRRPLVASRPPGEVRARMPHPRDCFLFPTKGSLASLPPAPDSEQILIGNFSTHADHCQKHI